MGGQGLGGGPGALYLPNFGELVVGVVGTGGGGGVLVGGGGGGPVGIPCLGEGPSTLSLEDDVVTLSFEDVDEESLKHISFGISSPGSNASMKS